MSNIVKDVIGQKFGRLLVIEFIETRKASNSKNAVKTSIWKCLCDCGNFVEIPLNRLVSGNTKSCGCIWKEKMRLPFGRGAFNSLLDRYKRQAQKRGYSFELSEIEFKNLVNKNCYYCGKEPQQKSKPVGSFGLYVYNGIDRLDNTKDYTIDNVITCCRRCNRAKDTMSCKEFFEWITNINLQIEKREKDNGKN